MCAQCEEICDTITYLRVELKKMRHHVKPLKHPTRAAYFREYYQKNRDKKLAAANERNRQQRA